MQKLYFPAALLLGSSFPALQAATLSPLPVTATRGAQTTDDSLAAVTVIDRDEIEHKQAQSVTELLDSAAGVQLVYNGGRGKSTSLYMRGTNSDQVLVLIDGIKVGSPTTGSTAFQHLEVDQIERIEIVRGPRSSLYGAEAVGGVIQIFTRPAADGFNPRFSAGLGNNNSHKLSLGASAKHKNAWFSADLSDYHTDGFSAKAPDKSGYNEDDDGYDNLSWALNGGYRFSDTFGAKLHWTRNEADNEYDGGSTFDDYSADTTLETIGATISLTPLQNWSLDLTLGRSRDDATQYGDGEYQSHIDTDRDSASLISRHDISSAHTLSWGVDYQEVSVDSSNDYTETSRDNSGIYGLYQGRFGAQDLAFSLRADDNSQFGRYNTGSLAWGMQFSDDMRVYASYGTAFKAPTLNDLYWPDSGWYKGNPDLEPEESETLELGLSGSFGVLGWQANAYQTEIENLIAYNSDTASPDNVEKARIRGLELSADTRLAAWDMAASLDIIDPKNTEDDSLLDRRARRIFKLSADRDHGDWSAGLSLQAVGEREDSGETLAGYTVLDLRGSFKVGRDWRFSAKINNLLNRQYETVDGYNQPDRGLWLSVNYRPQPKTGHAHE
ncbi:TonB-dependent vitamin B12 receptor [Granulosicoccaceae sp. 1_MG-2023]|nr:TonB-dependent vitamin B12 receptor [Granulosicoccaceae sp. 1_MG-2023]